MSVINVNNCNDNYVCMLAMSDLALELKKLNLSMPKKISWQFDNCGENKVDIHILFEAKHFSLKYAIILTCLE